MEFREWYDKNVDPKKLLEMKDPYLFAEEIWNAARVGWIPMFIVSTAVGSGTITESKEEEPE